MYKSFIVFITLIINLLIISNSHAQISDRVNFLSAQNLSELEDLFSNQQSTIARSKANLRARNLDNPVKVRVKVRGLGRLESSLSKERFYKLNSKDAAFLQGEVSNLSGKDPSEQSSFATIVNKKNGGKLLRLFFVGHSRKNSKNGWNGLVEVRASLSNTDGSYKLSRLSLHRSKRSNSNNLSCIGGASSSSVGTNHLHSHDGATIKAEVKIAKILLEADLEYENQISNSMPVELATIINGVDTIYQRDLGLSFDTTIADRSTAYTANIEYDQDFNILLHNEMKIAQPAESRGTDIHYLFTGKTPVGDDLANLAGVVPDLGTVCKTPVNSIGLTIRIDTATDIVVTAHEIGHLYSAEHDDNFTDPNNPNIMSSVVGGTITSFSSYSMSQISSFVSENGSCLVTGEGTGGGGGGGGGVTLPSTGRLYAFKRNRNFAVEVYDLETDEVYAGYTVTVLYRKKSRDAFTFLKELVTNDDGIASFRAKKRGQYIFQIGDKKSKKLQLR